MAFELAPFNPVITSTGISIPRTYWYSPSVTNGRIFSTVGLGTDTICSVRLGEPTFLRPAKPSIPYWRPDKLVADPYAVKKQGGYRVFHTIGELQPNGLGNGVGYYDADGNGNPIPKSERLLIKQNGRGTYGTGQPSVCLTPAGWVMFVRQDGPGGVNTLGAYTLIPASNGHQRVGSPLLFDHGLEDGVSPELFMWKGTLHMLLTGGGPVGVRSYIRRGDYLVRLKDLESSVNGFYAQNIKMIPEVKTATGDGSKTVIHKVRDGACIERDSNNQPIVSPSGEVGIWMGFGSDDPGTWMLRRATFKLP